MVSVQNFSKHYGAVCAAENISLELKKSSITALVGANGAGKTTLLKAICAMHFPDAGGKITVMGFDSVAYAEKVRSITGYVPETPALPPDFTVLEFLTLTGKIKLNACGKIKKLDSLRGVHTPPLGALKKGMYPESNHIMRTTYPAACGGVVDFKKQLQHVIEQCTLGDVLQKKITVLSKGYKQRLVLASAMIHDPDVLLLDEPASGLDPAQIVQLRQTIKAISSEKTIFISTHLMQEVEALCSDIHIMQNGKVVISGTKEEILKSTKQKTLDEAFLSLGK